ncbi:MAG: thymidylate synthase [Pseudomonadota bacterium]
MKRVAAVCALTLGIASCGDGNPFSATTTPDPGTPGGPSTSIPDSIAGDLTGFSFNPTAGTLTIEGVFLDSDDFAGAYVRTPSLDVPGYVAFTAQDDPLDQHVTAYSASIDGTGSAVAVTGGQFGTFNGGASFTRSGGFDAPTVAGDTGLVSYAGDYVGVTDLPGDGDELLPAPAIADPAQLPGQAAVVTGDIFINVDFNDNSLKGIITNRELDLDDALIASGTTLPVGDIALDPGTIASDGTFTGNVRLGGDDQDRGDYAGIFGGTDAQAVAGAIFIADHLVASTNTEEEYGIFVLGRCGSAVQTSTLCAVVEDFLDD